MSRILKNNSDGARIYLCPVGFVYGPVAAEAVSAGSAWSLAGGHIAFTGLQAIHRPDFRTEYITIPDWLKWRARLSASLQQAVDHMRERLISPRHIAGLRQAKGPLIMGIVNVTPDSFADGGLYFRPEAAIAHGRSLVEAGVNILDIGGESTRPGAEPVGEQVELERVLPVIEGLADTGIPISIDTRHAGVMTAAVRAGAWIVNDVSALTADDQSLSVAAGLDGPVVLMHALGNPKNMQEKPQYNNVLTDVYDYLDERISVCQAHGIARDRLIVDPGIGFGKTLVHNLSLLHGVGLFHALGVPVMLGVSRKSFIGRLTGVEDPSARIPGSLAAQLAAAAQGVQIIRVHDVSEMIHARAVFGAIISAKEWS